jgi:Uma2 family endonuclease
MALVLPWSRELTIDDLADAPDDGHRYELIDGGLIVTPAPGTNHQICVGRLHVLLYDHMPAGLTTLLGPYDYVISRTTKLQPDLLVARTSDLGPKNLQVTPLLVVEVLSPSTRYLDLGSKRLRYAAAGVPNYWIVDPDPEAPSLTALTLELDGGYHEAAVVRDEEAWTDPVLGVTVVPARLVGPVPTDP